jgi:hypothetical protein
MRKDFVCQWNIDHGLRLERVDLVGINLSTRGSNIRCPIRTGAYLNNSIVPNVDKVKKGSLAEALVPGGPGQN